MSFANKVALITGSGSGIGAATALSFAEEGAHVVIVDCSEERANSTAEKCKHFGNKVLIITADVSKKEDLKKIIKNTIEEFGRLDILVNNAGTIKEGKILDGTLMDTFDDIMNVNLRAAVLLTCLAAPHLIEAKGCIINTSSITGIEARTGYGYPSYTVSKAALNHFTRVSAMEFASSGVRVNAVNPGPCTTNILVHAGIPGSFEEMAGLTALKKVCEPVEVANLILYLASDKAKSITGCCHLIDNGMALV
ncbi:uncharacterized protein LOC111360250 [Spodoptera litura]|uniref:Uncharacterized protein LOC111360250 n=1 Tax=Spodoptera litura TaxID=69820 RepID=A0A9J7EP34_SPOLT|nr:uncharacterized protein LOC111360250 [Spodoptera litura]